MFACLLLVRLFCVPLSLCRLVFPSVPYTSLSAFGFQFWWVPSHCQGLMPYLCQSVYEQLILYLLLLTFHCVVVRYLTWMFVSLVLSVSRPLNSSIIYLFTLLYITLNFSFWIVPVTDKDLWPAGVCHARQWIYLALFYSLLTVTAILPILLLSRSLVAERPPPSGGPPKRA